MHNGNTSGCGERKCKARERDQASKSKKGMCLWNKMGKRHTVENGDEEIFHQSVCMSVCVCVFFPFISSTCATAFYVCLLAIHIKCSCVCVGACVRAMVFGFLFHSYWLFLARDNNSTETSYQKKMIEPQVRERKRAREDCLWKIFQYISW